MSGSDGRLQSYIKRGLAADRPSVQVSRNELYCSSDLDNLVEIYDGSAWQPFGRSGTVVQIKNFQTGATASGVTTIPIDNTLPQITEGTEFMTLAITPTSATNKLKIDVTINLSTTTTPSWYMVAALFQDATANALAAAVQVCSAADGNVCITFTHFMTAGTTSATTFRVRAGANAAGTTRLNGRIGAQLYGGALASSITITEIVP